MKIVKQDGIKDCGICCLLSIIRFYGGEVSKEYLREITHTTKEGVSLYDLINGAKLIGFEAIGLNGKIDNINVNNLPCIAHIIVNKRYKHFVVLYDINIKKKQVTLMDPDKGKKVISFSEFNLLSSDNYIFLKPNKKLPVIKNKRVILNQILNLTKTNKTLLILIIVQTIIYFILSIIVSFHFKYLLEYSINYNITYNIKVITYIMVIIYILKNINMFIKNTLLNKWISIFDIEATSNTYKQILLLPYLYYKNRTTGEVVSRFKDLNVIRNFICNFFCTITTDLISIVIFLIIMYNFNLKLTLTILSLMILISLYILVIIPKKKQLINKISKGEDTINSYLIQGVSNVDTIKGSHLEKRLIDKFIINYKSFIEIIYKYRLFEDIYTFIKNNLTDFMYILIYGLGSYFVIKKQMTLSSLIVYQSIFLYLLNCFYRIINVIEDYSSFKNAVKRVEEIFMISIDNFKNNFFYLPYDLSGNIEYKKLNYKIGTKTLFNNLNLCIKKGEKILLCGESGCGKSTLIKMLLRYIEVPYDNIKISDIDINHYHLENIRSNITYVTNNEFLFTDTIKNNILLYKEKNEEDFEKICKMCIVDDIVKKNLTGYETMIEENGFNLSNGERQRIILARSIMRNSNIYIFDEALSQIDITREKKILNNIFDYLKDKTIIVISHRFNNKKLFDRILKLENGKINES